MASSEITLDLKVTSDLFSLVAIRCEMLDCCNHSKSSTNCELKHITLDKNGMCKQKGILCERKDTTNS